MPTGLVESSLPLQYNTIDSTFQFVISMTPSCCGCISEVNDYMISLKVVNEWRETVLVQIVPPYEGMSKNAVEPEYDIQEFQVEKGELTKVKSYTFTETAFCLIVISGIHQ